MVKSWYPMKAKKYKMQSPTELDNDDAGVLTIPVHVDTLDGDFLCLC